MMPDLWKPPVEGIKADVNHRPTERERRAQQYAAEVLQQRYERWVTWHYTRILASTRRTLLGLDHIPDTTEIVSIVASTDKEQEEVLSKLMLNIYPSASAMVLPDDTLKSIRRMEVKELSLIQLRILAWIQERIRTNISYMDVTTVAAIESARSQSNDINEFARRLQASSDFSPTRARMIAVTETNVSVNAALAIAGDEASDGEPMLKQWMTTLRTNVRDTHRPMEGVIIPADELYRVPRRKGGYDFMEYPSDGMHGASLENIINCHCKSFPRKQKYE